MSKNTGRAEFLKANPRATAWAALEDATEQQAAISLGPLTIPPEHFKGKSAIIIGAGVGGLTTAYELLAQDSGMTVTVLEAQNRTGGRCLTLRTGDTLIEDRDAELFGSLPGDTQVVRFQRPLGDNEPYLNAGPGRIPSGHKRLLGYLRDFGVEIEVYVMNSMSNLVQMADGPLGDEPLVYRRVDHNVRGWIAQMVHQNARELLESLPSSAGIDSVDIDERTDQLERLMVGFGELSKDGKYVPDTGDEGFEEARSRAGFEVLPGVGVGVIAEALSLDCLLDSEFWRKTSFYQAADFLWQQAIFQPVGGMDRVQHAFAQQVAALGGTVHLSSPVNSIEWDSTSSEFVIQVAQVGTTETVEFRSDYCFSNLAMPFLSEILSDELQNPEATTGFSPDFKDALDKIYSSQNEPRIEEGVPQTFLAPTSKVGWQADRSLWQGSELVTTPDPLAHGHRRGVPESEVGVVPIFGGISWTDHTIKQIWYPSNDYHDEKGVLTGAYNFGEDAIKYGNIGVCDRLHEACEGAERFGKAFAHGLDHGVTVAWQNMPYIKGGWAFWQALGVEDDAPVAVAAFNAIAAGTSVTNPEGVESEPNFFVVGDQISSLPGWQEGAIAAALNALQRATYPGVQLGQLSTIPDTRLMVEGV
jgi:monoamine oxidase